MFIAFSCFCLSGASIAGEINVSRSSGDSSGSLPGVGWIRAGAHWWAGGDKLFQALHGVCRMGAISSTWELASLCFVVLASFETC